MNDDSITPIEDAALLAALRDLPSPEPDPAMLDDFRDLLSMERRAPWYTRPWVITALAASLVLTIGAGWWFDRTRKNEIAAELRQELHEAMASLSAASRLQAISQTGKGGQRDDNIARVLSVALLSDPNTNVRVAAAQALGRLASPGFLAGATEEALAKERSPFVQSALVEATQTLAPEVRQRLLDRLIAEPGLDPAVRAQAVAAVSLRHPVEDS